MPTYRGTIVGFEKIDTSEENWFTKPLFTFRRHFTPDEGDRPGDDVNRWYHFYFTLEKLRTSDTQLVNQVCKSPAKILKWKVSLFGNFDENLSFTLATRHPHRHLKSRIKKLFVDGLVANLSTGDLLEVQITCHAKRRHAARKCDLWREAKPRGWFYIIHTFWLGNFIAQADWDDRFELVDFFPRAACDLSSCSNDWIDITSYEDLLQEEGHHLGIFRKRLWRRRIASDEPNWLVSKTYLRRFGNPYAPVPDYHERVDFYVRLARTGIIEVREESRFENIPLIGFLEALSRGRPPITPPDSDDQTLPNSGELPRVRDIVDEFVRLLVGNYNVWPGRKKSFGLAPSEDDDEKNARLRRERQRYTVIVMSRLEGSTASLSIRPKDLWRQPSLLRNLLEGTMVYKPDTKELESPVLSQEVIQTMINSATWDDELCVFGSERCIIFFEPRTVLEADGRVINYEDYWKCIVRAIEHSVSVRTALLLHESWSKSRMEDIPGLVRQFDDYENKPAREMPSQLIKGIRILTITVADILKIMPSLREVSVAPSTFRAGHAVSKFDYLNKEIFKFPEIITHLQQNVDEMTNFLQFFKQRQLTILETERKQREGRIGTYLAIMGLSLAILAAFYTFPLFLGAFRSADVCQAATTVSDLSACFGSSKVIIFYGRIFLTAFLVVHTVGTILFFWVSRQNRGPGIWMARGVVIFIGILLAVFFGLWDTLDATGHSHLLEWILEHTPKRDFP